MLAPVHSTVKRINAMRRHVVKATKILAICCVGLIGPTQAADLSDFHVLDCENIFVADASAAMLSEEFGEDNLESVEIYIGEGFTEIGTVLFGNSPEDRVEILSKDVQEQKSPRRVQIHDNNSNWKTVNGISLSVDLQMLEKMNRKPLRLSGFAWDYGGTVISWSSGLLGRPRTNCRIGISLLPNLPLRSVALEKSYRQVLGETEYSSGHPAMQALNPKVYHIWLNY